jgi:uncharacterized glyoxalase superfamily protein PhnB
MKIHDLFAYLHVDGAAKAIDFYTSVFGATEKFRLTEPGGRIGHAELDFGGSTLMLADEFRVWHQGTESPRGQVGNASSPRGRRRCGHPPRRGRRWHGGHRAV